jgi:transposase-like protein
MAVNKGLGYEAYKEAYDRLGSTRAVARELNVNPTTVQRCLQNKNGSTTEPAKDKLSDLGYEVTGKELTSQDAWDSHADSFERSLTIATKEHWSAIERPAGAYVVAHFTDPACR